MNIRIRSLHATTTDFQHIHVPYGEYDEIQQAGSKYVTLGGVDNMVLAGPTIFILQEYRSRAPGLTRPRQQIYWVVQGRNTLDNGVDIALGGDRMAEVLLFHHAHGLTKGVLGFADELRRAGHEVHVPDLYDGHVFDSLDDGLAYARQVGFATIQERAIRAADGLPADLVYAGFSLGAMPAQQLAQTRAGARGALLFHSCAPTSEFGTGWPADVPVQVHGMEADPFFTEEGGDLDAARALIASTDQAELFLYPGNQHLFADSSLPSYNAAAASLLTRRVLDFLDIRVAR